MKTYKDLPGDRGSNIIGQVTAQLNRLQRRMASIRHTVAVMSGKGGVGKQSQPTSHQPSHWVDALSGALMLTSMGRPSPR